MFEINDIERLTSIKAHTIRIWEKRYNLLTPHRTDTNIRYYDDDQIRKILNVNLLVNHGYKISKVAAMSETEMVEQINDIQEEDSVRSSHDTYVNDLINAMIGFDELSFDKVLTASITRFGLYQAYLDVIYPFLVKTGVLWTTKNIMPAQEHLIANIIRKKIIASIDGLPMPKKKGKIFILFLLPNEWHEMGLLLADFLIRQKGYMTIYLGQNVPTNCLAETIEKTKALQLVTFYHRRNHTETNRKELEELVHANSGAKLHVCTTEEYLKAFEKSSDIYTYAHPQNFIEEI